MTSADGPETEATETPASHEAANQSTKSQSTKSQRPKKRHLWLKIGLPILLVPLIGVAIWISSALTFVYSNGERTGYVQKLSRSGWVCKTWEGELAMSPFPNAQMQIFKFTIRNDSLARALEAAAGKQVSLYYGQRKGIPTSCFGETEYFIESFKAVGGS